MHRVAVVPFLVVCLFASPAAADEPAAGKLLVATEEIRGAAFARTVVLLLHYDQTGAMGLIVNRPTAVAPDDVFAGAEEFSRYRGTLYWGGPVDVSNVRALRRSDAPPEGAVTIVEDVHLVPADAALEAGPASPATLRFFIGYAGWAAGQLDREMAADSWHVVPAKGDLVFAEDPDALWKQLVPVREYRAALDQPPSRSPSG